MRGRSASIETREIGEDERLSLLREACEIIEYWRGRLGLTAEDIVFYGEHSGLALEEFGDLWVDLFHDGKRLVEIAWKLGMQYREIEEECKKVKTSTSS